MNWLLFDWWFLRKQKQQQLQAVVEWIRQGRPLPPPHILKQRVIAQFQEQYKIGTLVETGTFMGDMIEANKRRFNKIYSIELGHELAENAMKRFGKERHIEILEGDSGVLLHDLVPKLPGRTIFWLDGHYSSGITAKGEKECPIFEELEAIFNNNKGHVILIDDARCYTGAGGFPVLQEVLDLITLKNTGYLIETRDDIIRAWPNVL